MPDKPVVIIDGAPPAAEPLPTAEEAATAGLSEPEIASAKEHGLLAKPEGGDDDKGEGDDAGKGDDDKGDGEKDPAAEAENDDDTGGDKSGKEKKDEGKEEQRVSDAIDKDLPPEQEHAALEKFNSNERALYFRLKKEKTKRQSSEAERDHETIKRKAAEQKAAALEAELAALKKAPKKEADPEDPLGDDAEGKDDKKDPQFLTEKDLEEREKKKEEASAKALEERRERAQKLTDAHKTLELDGKARYTDYDQVTTLGSEILKAQSEGKLEEMFPDPRIRSKVNRQIVLFLQGMVRADEYKEGEYNPADMAYELGTSHPKYKGNPKPKPGKSGKDQDQTLTPEEIEEIAKRRQSSAAINGGGGKRAVSYDDLTVEDAANLSDAQFRKLPREVRERLKAS